MIALLKTNLHFAAAILIVYPAIVALAGCVYLSLITVNDSPKQMRHEEMKMKNYE